MKEIEQEEAIRKIQSGQRGPTTPERMKEIEDEEEIERIRRGQPEQGTATRISKERELHNRSQDEIDAEFQDYLDGGGKTQFQTGLKGAKIDPDTNPKDYVEPSPINIPTHDAQGRRYDTPSDKSRGGRPGYFAPDPMGGHGGRDDAYDERVATARNARHQNAADAMKDRHDKNDMDTRGAVKPENWLDMSRKDKMQWIKDNPSNAEIERQRRRENSPMNNKDWWKGKYTQDEWDAMSRNDKLFAKLDAQDAWDDEEQGITQQGSDEYKARIVSDEEQYHKDQGPAHYKEWKDNQIEKQKKSDDDAKMKIDRAEYETEYDAEQMEIAQQDQAKLEKLVTKFEELKSGGYVSKRRQKEIDDLQAKIDSNDVYQKHLKHEKRVEADKQSLADYEKRWKSEKSAERADNLRAIYKRWDISSIHGRRLEGIQNREEFILTDEERNTLKKIENVADFDISKKMSDKQTLEDFGMTKEQLRKFRGRFPNIVGGGNDLTPMLNSGFRKKMSKLHVEWIKEIQEANPEMKYAEVFKEVDKRHLEYLQNPENAPANQFNVRDPKSDILGDETKPWADLLPEYWNNFTLREKEMWFRSGELPDIDSKTNEAMDIQRQRRQEILQDLLSSPEFFDKQNKNIKWNLLLTRLEEIESGEEPQLTPQEELQGGKELPGDWGSMKETDKNQWLKDNGHMSNKTFAPAGVDMDKVRAAADEKFKIMVQNFDTDGDGKLSSDEASVAYDSVHNWEKGISKDGASLPDRLWTDTIINAIQNGEVEMADSIEQEHGAETLQNYQDAIDQGQDFDFMDDFIDKRMPEEPIEGWRDFISNIPTDVPLWPGWDRGEAPPEDSPYSREYDKFMQSSQQGMWGQSPKTDAESGQPTTLGTPQKKTDAEKEQIKKDAQANQFQLAPAQTKKKLNRAGARVGSAAPPVDTSKWDEVFVENINDNVKEDVENFAKEYNLNVDDLQWEGKDKYAPPPEDHPYYNRWMQIANKIHNNGDLKYMDPARIPEFDDNSGPSPAPPPLTADEKEKVETETKEKNTDDLYSWTNGPYGFKKWREFIQGKIEGAKSERWPGASQGNPPPKGHPLEKEFNALVGEFLTKEKGEFIPPDREIKTEFKKGWRREDNTTWTGTKGTKSPPNWVTTETKPAGDWPKHFTEQDKRVHPGNRWRVKIGGLTYSWDKLTREIKKLDDAVSRGREKYDASWKEGSGFDASKARLEAMVSARNKYWDFSDKKKDMSIDILPKPSYEPERWPTKETTIHTEFDQGKEPRYTHEEISKPEWPSNWTDEDKLIHPGPNWTVDVVLSDDARDTPMKQLSPTKTMTWEQLNNEIERLDKPTSQGVKVVGWNPQQQKDRLQGYINARNAYWDWAEKEFGK